MSGAEQFYGDTSLRIFGDGEGRGGCDGPIGSPNCTELLCLNVSPGFAPSDVALCGFPGIGSRFDSLWATHAPVVTFGHEAWDFYMEDHGR